MPRVVLDSDDDDDTSSPVKPFVSNSHGSTNGDNLTGTAEQGAMPSTTSTGSLAILSYPGFTLLIPAREVVARYADRAQCLDRANSVR